MKTIKVSCVLITHNRLKLLERAVESVMKQTYSNIELIVVDDASSDGTQEYGKKLIRSGYKYIYISPEESKGGNYARNCGIRACTGDFIAFLDDDDYWIPEKTEKQVTYFFEHPDVGMVYSGWTVDYGNAVLNYKRIPSKNYCGNIVEKQLYISPFTSTITMMVRKDILDQIKGFDENLKYWQEYELVLRIIQVTNVGFVGMALSVANRERNVKRLTSQFDDWNSAVNYINDKHKKLFARLSTENSRKREEYYYKEAAYRVSMCGDFKRMKEYYYKAYMINPKLEYLIRYKFGISKNHTILIESLIMKVLYWKTKFLYMRCLL